jgi:hypothetical protein
MQGNTVALAVGGVGLAGLGYLWYQRQLRPSVAPAVRQSLADALRNGGVAGCQAAAALYKVPPQISGPLCGLGGLAAVAGIKAAIKVAPKVGKVAYKAWDNPIGKVVAAPVTMAVYAVRGVKKLFGLGDLGDDGDLQAYAQMGPARARQRVKGGLRLSGAGGCSGLCGCAPCGPRRRGGGGARSAYLAALR